MKKNIFMVSAIFLCSLFLSSCKQEHKVQLVQKSFTVKLEEKAEELFFSGTLMPIREQAIISPKQATVMKMYFDFGSMVSKGQELIKLNSPEQKKDYEETLTGFLKAKDQLEIAKAKFTGTESLWKDGLVAENSYKSDQSSLFTNKIAFIQARSKLVELAKKITDLDPSQFEDLTFAHFNKIQHLLDKDKNKIILKAPFEGIALESKSDSSDKSVLRVGSQLKESGVITLIGDISGLLINIKVPEVNIDKLKVGMKAIVTGIAFPTLTLDAKVEGINAQANSTSGSSGGVPIFNARVKVSKLTKHQQQELKVGMSAKVKVILSSKKIMMIPIKAIKQVNGENIVTLKNKDGTLTKKKIQTGYATAQKVLVQSGLIEGDTIVWQIKE